MVRIYGTIGPSCNSQDILEAMLDEGMTGMRLNLSHTTLEKSAHDIESYRKACLSRNVPMDLMIDIQGAQIRTGQIDGNMIVSSGDRLIITTNEETSKKVITVSPVVLRNLSQGDHILIQDGLIELEVNEYVEPEAAKKGFYVKVIRGGEIRSRQNIKIEGKEIYEDVLPEEDLMALDQATFYGVTGIMQPFVRDGADVRLLRDAIRKRGLDLRIFAKIETPAGIRNLPSIIEEADEIVIARGDLGNAIPLWELPRVQKEISRMCVERGRDFMVVTQMLHSMMSSPVPTRAEVSDIFNAVMDGASSVMVTGECARGAYPVEVIKYLSQTVREAKRYIVCFNK